MNNPNAVVFKLDNGQLCIVVRKNDTWDWDNIIRCKMEPEDPFPDISKSNPFEFVFAYWDGIKVKTTKVKTTIHDTSFAELYDAKIFEEIIDYDYNNQYGIEV